MNKSTCVFSLLFVLFIFGLSLNAFASTVGPSGADYTTIQAAIDAAIAGGTINVAAGTYAGKIVIGKPVILKGPNFGISPNTGIRVAEAIITGTDVADPIIEMTSGNLDGLTIDGFTISDVTTIGQQQVIHLITDGDNVAIRNNRFLNNSGRVFISGPARSGLVIADNLIDGMTQDNQAGMQLFTMNYCQITNNVVKNTTYGGIQLGGATNCTISGNTVENVPRSGIAVDNSSDIAIQNNSVTNAGNGVGAPATVVAGDDLTENGGVTIYNADQTDITISGNTLTNNFNGVTVRAGATLGLGIIIQGNSITGNVNAGIDNQADGTLDATNNWWGSAAGPGALVSSGVDFDPWYIDGAMFNLSNVVTNAVTTAVEIADPLPIVNAAAGVTVDIAGAAGTGTVTASAFLATPVTAVTFSAAQPGKTALKYVDVQVTGLTAGTAVITIDYTDAEVTAKGIDENTLILYVWYGGAWNAPVSSPGRDITNNKVWGTFNVTDLTGAPAAPGGNPPPPPIPTLNEWGLIILFLSIAAYAVLSIKKRYAVRF